LVYELYGLTEGEDQDCERQYLHKTGQRGTSPIPCSSSEPAQGHISQRRQSERYFSNTMLFKEPTANIFLKL
jgi:hypothetical protein